MHETPARNETIAGHPKPILNIIGTESASDPRCRVELFGGLRLLQGDRVVTRFRTHKAATLLAYLALHLRQSHPRDQLVDLFWPEMDLEPGRTNLSTALTSLRRQLEPPGIPAGSLLVADRRTVQLNPGAVTTDVAELDALLDTASRTEELPERTLLLERTVDLYRGELLPGCYEEWALLERARCSERSIDALEELAAAREETGDLEAAVAAARRAVEADPYREEPYRVQMRCLAAQSRVGAALESYRKLEEVLQADLGVSPAATTRELAERLRRDPGSIRPVRPAPLASDGRQPTADRTSVPPPSAAQHPIPPDASEHERAGDPAAVGGRPSTVASLPLQLTRFFGREEEVADLTRRLVQPETRLLTLTGPGGAGKTRLAIEVARQVAPAFDGRVWFVELAALPDPNLIPFALAQTLKLSLSPDKDPLETVVERLADLPCLLLLDNVEHLLRNRSSLLGPESPPASKSARPAGATALVRLLLERVPQLTCLATSRQPLHLGGEQEFPVPPLGMPTGTETPERLLQWGSVALYADRAQLARPDFAVTERNGEAVAELCRKLEGMPLAIEMAAAWAKLLPPTRMLERLERQLDLLVSRRRDLPPRHQSLRATIEWSYGLLSLEQQACFARLSVFRGGWSLEAAEAVCGGEALRLLSELQEQSLVVILEGQAETRYRMLEPLREYAAEKLRECGEEASARAAQALYFLSLAEEARAALECSGRVWLDRLETEHDNLRAALRWYLEERDAASALRLAAALVPFWEVRFHLAEGQQWLESVLALPEAANAGVARARALAGAARLAVRRMDRSTGQRYWEEALAICRQREDRRGIAELLLQMGELEGYLSPGPEAAAGFAESLAFWREVGDRASVARTLFLQARLATARAAFPEARALHAEAAALNRELGDLRSAALNLRTLGDLSNTMGDYAVARTHLEESLAIDRQLDNRLGISEALLGIGQASYDLGDYPRARACWEEVLAIDTDKMGGGGYVLVCLAAVDRVEGDIAGARAGYEATRAGKLTERPRRNPAHGWSGLADLALAAGDETTAQRLYSECLPRYEAQPGEKWELILHRHVLWRLARRQGDTAASRALYQQALAYHETLMDPMLIAHSLRFLGVMAGPEEDRPSARRFLRESLLRGQEMEHREITVGSLRGLMELAVREGEWERAARLGGAAAARDPRVPRSRRPLEQYGEEALLTALRAALGEARFAAAWTEGHAMTLEQAIDDALSCKTPA
jgi:predicted ATPase/DNA-binding SARP family transcriptional activator